MKSTKPREAGSCATANAWKFGSSWSAIALIVASAHGALYAQSTQGPTKAA